MWGTSTVRQLCKAASKLGYTRMALTDTDNLYGMWPFIDACRDHNIQPIIGAELTDPGTRERAILLVKSQEGYTHLCGLITARHMEKEFDLLSQVTNRHRGLAVLTQSSRLLRAWHDQGVMVFLSLPRQPVSPWSPVVQTARDRHIPAVAVPDSFYSSPEDAPLHRMLRAIDLKTTLDRITPPHCAGEGSFLLAKDAYEDRFAICPEAISNTYNLAEQLEFDGPNFGLVMPPWSDKDGLDADGRLREAAYTGARKRYGRDLSETVVDRLEHELAIIRSMKFSSYFLVVKDIVALSPRICGRGSGAASLVAYCLHITNVCPVKHNLYFERFLNPGRKDPPDIDVDFPWDERDRVLEKVFSRYPDHCAMVANHVCIKPRMAVREVARVYGLTETEISRVTQKMPWYFTGDGEGLDILEMMSRRPESKALSFPSPWPDIMKVAQKICGLPRYLSVHPGGMVITPDPICHYVPVERAAKGVNIIQWEKDQTERAGLVKIDLLGNRSLGVIRDAIINLKQNNCLLDESTWEPEDDWDTQETVAQGNTMGCFYIESPATRLLQKKAHVGDFAHMVIHSSIIRPAANDYIQAYLERLHGAPWDPIHPLLAHILDESYGIMVYQEDVSKAAVAVAGFSHGDADGLRKIMSKKDKARALKDFYRQFAEGARKKGVSDSRINDIWQMMMSFSGYSFCKPHSASYAKVSFQAAWLKVHFPAEFMAAVISNQGGFYSTFAYVSEAMRMGLTVLPPDVNQSHIRWRGHGRQLRVGLLSVAQLSRATMEKLMVEQKKALFRDMGDFLVRVRPEDPEKKSLVACGALDTLRPGVSRSALMWQLAFLKKHSLLPEEDVLPLPVAPRSLPEPPAIQDDPVKRFQQEFAALGFLCASHPMTLYAPLLVRHRVTKACRMGRFIDKNIRMAGFLVTGKVVRTRHGDPMEFLTFEDETDIFETTFFPKTYARVCHKLAHGRPYVLWGVVDVNWGAVTLTVDRVEALPDIDSL